MKRSILVLILASTLINITQAQKNVIGLGANAYGLVPRLTYERTIFKKIAVVIGYERGKYAIGYSPDNISMREDNYVKGWGIMPEFRFYPFTKFKSAPLGVFIGAHYRYRWLTEHYFVNANNFIAKAKAYNYGINFGYKLNVDFLTFDFLAGFGKSAGNWETVNSGYYMPSGFEGKDLYGLKNHARLEVTVGFLFPYEHY